MLKSLIMMKARIDAFDFDYGLVGAGPEGTAAPSCGDLQNYARLNCTI
jgi:hypothetical protein